MGFFFEMYLFIGPTQSAVKSPKQFLTYVYFISAVDRELRAEHNPISQLCAACRMHWWPVVGGGRERAGETLPRFFNVWNCKDKSSKVICPR